MEETGLKCIELNHLKLNQDGYLRVNTKTRGGVMMHRLVWEHVNGPIPEGYEINHLCKNRACQNIKHLECIPGSEHATKSNLERDFSIGRWKKGLTHK